MGQAPAWSQVSRTRNRRRPGGPNRIAQGRKLLTELGAIFTNVRVSRP